MGAKQHHVRLTLQEREDLGENLQRYGKFHWTTSFWGLCP